MTDQAPAENADQAPAAAAEENNEAHGLLFGPTAWQAFLLDKPLPARASSVTRLRKLLRDDSAPIQKLSQAIKTDPILCFHIVMAAQQLHQSKKGSSVTSIDHAIQSLGITKLEACVRKIPTLKLNPNSVQHKQYFRAIANSQHAATQCYNWLRDRRAAYCEEAQLAALFYGVGFWMLWLHAPLHMHQIQHKVIDQGIDPQLAENDVLGCSTQHISHQLAEAWQMPQLMIDAVDHQKSPSKQTLKKLHQRALKDPRIGHKELRALNHIAQEQCFPVKLANWFALTVHRGWEVERTVRITDIITDFIGKDRDEVTAILHRNCAEAARLFHPPGVLTPAADMLLQTSQTRGNYKIGAAELKAILAQGDHPKPEKPRPLHRVKAEQAKQAQAEQGPPPADFLDANIYRQIASRFIKGYDLYTKPAHILQGLMLGLQRGLGMERCALQLVQSKKHRLKTAQALGFDEEHPLYRYELDLDVPSLFRKLTEQPSCIWINARTRPNLEKSLPDAFKAALPANDALLMSVFYRDEPIAIIYGDMGEDTPPMDDFYHQRFRYLCSAATVALKHLGRDPDQA